MIIKEEIGEGIGDETALAYDPLRVAAPKVTYEEIGEGIDEGIDEGIGEGKI